VFAATQRIQSNQLAGQMEPHHLFVARFAEGGRLERPLARDIDRRQCLADPEQPLPALDGALATDDFLKPGQLGRVDTGRQAELLQ